MHRLLTKYTFLFIAEEVEKRAQMYEFSDAVFLQIRTLRVPMSRTITGFEDLVIRTFSTYQLREFLSEMQA